jgi:hypothetical protein|tara:strand:+ start:4853 stop:4975 length:123 start_codon:yes stop_codon:yes gene_type:complete
LLSLRLGLRIIIALFFDRDIQVFQRKTACRGVDEFDSWTE